MATKVTKKEAEEFVKETLTRARYERSACSDGRYEPEQSQGFLRVFGGDFGLVMAFAGALKDEGTYLDSDEIVERYSRAKTSQYGESSALDYHTDSHSLEKGVKGCGHAAKASSPEYDGLYNLPYNQIEDLYKSFEKHPKSHITVLQGDHKERGVLFIKGKDHTVHSKNKKGDSFFVVDIDRINHVIDELSPKFSTGLLQAVNPEDVKVNYLKQMSATAELLKADQIPHFEVKINENGHFTMEELSKSPKKKTN